MITEGTKKNKKRVAWYLSKIDLRVKNKIKKEAENRSISPWLLTEYLLTEALGINDKPTSKIFKK